MLSSVLIPAALSVFERVFADVVLTQNMMLNAIFAGLGIGISVGVVLRAGSSTGGTDIPPLILQKYFNIPAAAGVWVLDYLLKALAGEYEMKMAIYPGSFVISILLTVGMSLLVSLMVARRNKRIEKGFIVVDSSDSGRVRIAVSAIEAISLFRRSYFDEK